VEDRPSAEKDNDQGAPDDGHGRSHVRLLNKGGVLAWEGAFWRKASHFGDVLLVSIDDGEDDEEDGDEGNPIFRA
jgi:hypothetical protein